MKWMCYLLIFVIRGATSDGVYYVSDDPTLCPVNQQCYNLSFYTMYPEDYFTSDTIFYFMEGNHVINHSELILITNASNITLQGLTDTTETITCVNGSGGLSFYDCNQITLKSLHFHNCGGALKAELNSELDDRIALDHWNFTYFGDTYHTLLFAFVTGLEIFGVTVNNSVGRALSALNTYNVHMSNCSISYGNIDSYYNPVCLNTLNTKCLGGNAFFVYLDTKNCLRNTESYYYVNISNSSFSYGIDRVRSQLFNAGLGFGLYFTSNIGINVTINSVTLTGNTAADGANFFFGAFTRYHTLTINNMTSTLANSIYPFSNTEGYIKTYGGGFHYQAAGFVTVSCNSTLSKNDDTNRLTVTNSKFMHNIARDGAGMLLNVLPGLNSIVSGRFIKLENCTIRNNSGEVGVAMFLREVSTFQPMAQLHFDLVNISISSNSLLNNLTTEHDVSTSAVLITSAGNVTFIDVSITDHVHLTGLHVYNSVITIKETNTTISNNSAERGGGVYLRGSSELVFLPPANLILANNTAAYGGAIYIQKTVIADDRPLCFFQIVDEGSVTTRITPSTHIISINNTATVTGDFLYSSTGALFKCRMTAAFLDYTKPYIAFGKFVILDQQNNYSTISSDPVKACFCNEDGLPDCSITSTSINVIPGTYFDITVAAVGLEDGVTPGIINYVQNFNGTKNESVYRVEKNCTKMNRLLYVLEGNTIQLTVDVSSVPVDNIPLKIYLNVLPCPYGFDYSSNIGSCVCNGYIFKDIATCDSTTWNITREGNYWISYDTKGNCTMFADCPFDYCIKSSVTFSPTAPDPQCNHNRAGPLCGKCADGFSLMLGSNKCAECTNHYLALIVVFALAGILLVVFIFALNLTVTVGTINGLIFYANIVKLNESAFFADGHVHILSHFIAWLNLDFGIEICFFDGLDAYTKTWLQIVFPLYIAGIVVCIIILCRYSNKLSKLVGNNAVPVLATLILLSYTKILRVITTVLQLGELKCDGQLYSTVWLVDGSVNYFDVKHGFLVIAALFTLIFIALPYTLLILFIPLIQRKTPRHLKWILKLMPYFDATCGELHNGYRFWSGFLLVIRLVLGLILPFAPPNIDTSAILGTTIIIFVIIWNFPLALRLYKRRYLDILESWFFLNLGFISMMSLNGSGYAGTIISTSLVLATFIGIVICHLCWRIYTLLVKKEMPGVNSENTNSQQQERKEEPAEWKIKVRNIISYFFNRVESSSGHTSAEQIQDNNFFIAIDEGREEGEKVTSTEKSIEMVYFGISSTQSSADNPSSYATNEISLPTESVIVTSN